MHSHSAIAGALAAAFLAGELEVDGLVDRGGRLLGRRWRWLRPLARRVAGAWSGRTRPRRASLKTFILADRGFARACEETEDDFGLANLVAAPTTMRPVEAARTWPVAPLPNAEELARWLDVPARHLQWFADLRSWEQKRSRGRLRHYHYRPLTKRFGQVRLVEAPKPRLKEIQRRILTGILDQIPPHTAAHGFRHGRSIASYAAPHVGRRVVVKIDLQDFFPSIPAARIQALFRTVGYPEDVADLLAGLCTNCTPPDVWDEPLQPPVAWPMRQARWRYGQPHLPQGAPTSPALANLCAYRLDCRLTGLAAAAAAVYTRYADDMAFSGDCDFERAAKRFHLHACAVVMEEGFSVHHRKTRIMRRGVRQRLAGLVVNDRLNVVRADFDRLKATLTNCLRHGPDSQNRDGRDEFRGHLEGRVAFIEMINPAKGRRLRRLFEQVEWGGQGE